MAQATIERLEYKRQQEAQSNNNKNQVAKEAAREKPTDEIEEMLICVDGGFRRSHKRHKTKQQGLMGPILDKGCQTQNNFSSLAEEDAESALAGEKGSN